MAKYKKEILSLIEKVFSRSSPEVKERSFVMYSSCLSKPGQWVRRDPRSLHLNICDNPRCPTCRQLNDAIKSEAKKFLNNINLNNED